MFAAAGMLLATSCSNDELDQVQSSSDQAQVTFSLGLEGGMATRAISDGTGAKKLVCAVYDANDNVIKTISINNTAVNAHLYRVFRSSCCNNMPNRQSVNMNEPNTALPGTYGENIILYPDARISSR